jgi:hypothetical protein
MKRPSFFAYLIGNPISALGICGYAFMVIYWWWIGRVEGLAAILAVFAISITMDAGHKVSEYSHWKRSWNAMAGIVPGAFLYRLRKPIGVLVWVGMTYGISRLNPKDPANSLVFLGYGVGTAMIICVLLYRMVRGVIRWTRRRRKPLPVSVNLGVPRSSPATKQIYKGLPSYCRQVLQ